MKHISHNTRAPNGQVWSLERKKLAEFILQTSWFLLLSFAPFQQAQNIDGCVSTFFATHCCVINQKSIQPHEIIAIYHTDLSLSVSYRATTNKYFHCQLIFRLIILPVKSLKEGCLSTVYCSRMNKVHTDRKTAWFWAAAQSWNIFKGCTTTNLWSNVWLMINRLVN